MCCLTEISFYNARKNNLRGAINMFLRINIDIGEPIVPGPHVQEVATSSCGGVAHNALLTK